jgi:hypothetical protein
MCVSSSTENDRSLLRRFDRHRPVFEKFIALENEKGLFSISNRAGRCELVMEPREFSQEEAETLCAEMRRMGVESIYGSEHEIEFLAALESYTEYKSYVFRTDSPLPPHLLVEDLDGLRMLGAWYRHIEGNWYLYLRRDD